MERLLASFKTFVGDNMRMAKLRLGDIIINQFGVIALVAIDHGGYTDLPLQIQLGNGFLAVDFDGTSPYNSLIWKKYEPQN